MVRRSVAVGAAVLALILLVLVVRGCLDSRRQSAIEDYVRDAGALVQESNQQSDALFETLDNSAGASDVDVQNALNSYRVQSAQLVDRARDLDVPDDLAAAQDGLVETLDFRRAGVSAIADALPDAMAGGDQRKGAADAIAGAMQSLLASDQVYAQRVVPNVNRVLEENDLTGQERLPRSQFLPDVSWLQPSELASRIDQLGGTGDGEDAAAGVHGNGLGTVTLGGQALTPGGSTGITASDDLAFEVQVANQGENTETDVPINVTVGSGGDAIELEKVLGEIAAGETQTVEIPIGRRPPTGQNVPIKVEIGLVPGEDADVGNNEADFSAIFTS